MRLLSPVSGHHLCERLDSGRAPPPPPPAGAGGPAGAHDTNGDVNRRSDVEGRDPGLGHRGERGG